MAEVKLDIPVKATDEASSVFDKISQSSERMLKQLHESFGRGSQFKETFDLLGASGPIIGFGLAAHQIKEAADHLQEVKQLMRDSAAGASDVARAFGHCVPVLGDIIDAGQSIRQLFTDEKDQLDAIEAATKIQNDYMDAQRESAKRVNDELKDQREQLRKIAEAWDQIGLSGPAKSFMAQSQAIDDIQEKIRGARAGGNAAPKELQEALAQIDQNDIAKKIEAMRKAKEPLTQREIQTNAAITTAQAAVRPGYTDPVHGGTLGQAGVDAATKLHHKAVQDLADANAEINKLSDQQRDARQKKTQDYINGLKEQTGLGNQQLLQLQHEFGQAQYKGALETQGKLGQTLSDARAEQLRASGQFYWADLEQLRQAQEQRTRELETGLAAQLKAIDEARRGGILNSLEAATAAATAVWGSARQGAAENQGFDAQRQEAARTESQRQQGVQSRIGELGIGESINPMAAMGPALELERQRVAVEEEYARKRSEILSLEQKATTEQKDQLKAINAQVDANEKLAQQALTRNSLKDVGESLLGGLAGTGNRAAERQLREYQIHQQFDQQRAQLHGILNDKSATSAQKAQAQTELDAVGGVEKQEVLAARRQNSQMDPFAQTHLNAGGNHGVAMAAQEQEFLRKGNEEKTQSALLQKVVDLLGRIDFTLNKPDDDHSVFGRG